MINTGETNLHHQDENPIDGGLEEARRAAREKRKKANKPMAAEPEHWVLPLARGWPKKPSSIELYKTTIVEDTTHLKGFHGRQGPREQAKTTTIHSNTIELNL